MTDTLSTLIAAEFGQPQTQAEKTIVNAVLARWGDAVSCVLFYGSKRRDRDKAGLLDLYVLTDSYVGVHRSQAMAMANRVLPPNVFYLSVPSEHGQVAAKIAVISRRAFAARMRPSSLDTTLWTRFCQPSTLLYARDPAIAEWSVTTIARAIRTAFFWADRLAGSATSADKKWRELFRRTYRLEIRPERNGRGDIVYEAARSWFDEAASVITHELRDSRTLHSWTIRALVGKPLNLLRLLKAAFTFLDGADYLSDKLSRHTGIRQEPTDWQRRHPILGAPSYLYTFNKMRRARSIEMS